MRTLCCTVLLLVGFVTAAVADTVSFHVGIVRITIAAKTPFNALIWYPTLTEEHPWQAGPFSIPASRDAPFAPGRFPVVLLSHGGGLTGGSPLILRELAASLARQGFVVIAPFHGKAGLAVRPLQVTWAWDTVRADPRFAPHIDAARVGMLGFSLGTAVTLELAGAIPNIAHLLEYCATHATDVMSCDHAPGGNGRAPTASDQPLPAPASLPLKAIVLLDPFAVLFQRAELTAVTMPVLIFRPEQSELPGEANAFALAGELPRKPEFRIIAGGHFIFTDVCGPELRATAPELCQDPVGVDRAAAHAGIEARIGAFFRETL
jgi:predicted dienelactone hydrolase